MRKMWNAKRIAAVLAGAGLGLAGALPAAAGTIYAWRTDDGGYAFADDLKRVPEHYRDRVEKRQSAGLESYARYTPQDDRATAAQLAQLQARLAELRQRNAELERQATLRAAATAAQPGTPVEVRFTDAGDTVVQVPSETSPSGPVVIEKVRMLYEDGVRTRTNTVVRRGDDVLAVIRPVKPETDLHFPEERSFER